MGMFPINSPSPECIARNDVRRRRRLRSCPRLEQLEGRIVMSTFQVSTTLDTVALDLRTGKDSTGHISLRSAIMVHEFLPGRHPCLPFLAVRRPNNRPSFRRISPPSKSDKRQPGPAATFRSLPPESFSRPNCCARPSILVRACHAVGVIGLASRTPEGFIGEMFRVFSKYIPATAGLAPPIRWGDEVRLREIFGDVIASMTNQVRATVFRFASAKDNVDFFRRYYGPTLKTCEALPASGREALEQEMIELNRRFDRNGGKGGPIAISADCLETVIVRVTGNRANSGGKRGRSSQLNECKASERESNDLVRACELRCALDHQSSSKLQTGEHLCPW